MVEFRTTSSKQKMFNICRQSKQKKKLTYLSPTQLMLEQFESIAENGGYFDGILYLSNEAT